MILFVIEQLCIHRGFTAGKVLRWGAESDHDVGEHILYGRRQTKPSVCAVSNRYANPEAGTVATSHAVLRAEKMGSGLVRAETIFYKVFSDFPCITN